MTVVNKYVGEGRGRDSKKACSGNLEVYGKCDIVSLLELSPFVINHFFSLFLFLLHSALSVVQKHGISLMFFVVPS